jgi:hypothetical protein
MERVQLPYMQNYIPYEELVTRGHQTINVTDINQATWEMHYKAIFNILKDGIEEESIQESIIQIIYQDGSDIELFIIDYWINLMIWRGIINAGDVIQPCHIFFLDEIKADDIKQYIDDFFIDIYRKSMSSIALNNTIDAALHPFKDIDTFSMFLADTVNLSDFSRLMKLDPEFYECLHPDMSNCKIEDAKAVGMSITNKMINIIKNSKDKLGYDHCLADSFRASEGVNTKQFKEFATNIGSKPDGQGGVFPVIIENSFINGGVHTPIDYMIESSTGRTAQILKKLNVGSSGHFARLLGLNSMDSTLNQDPSYDCGTRNFLKIFIKDEKVLEKYNNRYYRMHPKGLEKLLKAKRCRHLIGKTIYVRSPICCASNARGNGICYRCYGDLAYSVSNINIGRIASETLSSVLTQKLLSAKHLLETAIEKLNWVSQFNDFFEVNTNYITIFSGLENIENYRLIIDPDNIELEDEEDDDLSGSEDKFGPLYNEYITEFDVYDKSTDTYYHICNDKAEKLYITSELNSRIRRHADPENGKIVIRFTDIEDEPLLVVNIQNNELSKTLEHLQDLLNKNAVIRNMDKDELMQALVETAIEGGLQIAAIHMEVLLSNQIRDPDNILDKPEWWVKDCPYEIVTLNTALTDNPSVVISMDYQKLAKTLYNPLTFKKNAPSFMDLFFMERPQAYINNTEIIEDEPIEPGRSIDPFIPYENPNKFTVNSNADIDFDDIEG